MRKQTYLSILLLTCSICTAQNLVPNGDFEQYSSCPTSISQIDLALPWFNPCDPPYGASGTGSGSPDYFNACSGTSVGVPVNQFGYQQAHSGSGYAGFYLYRSDNFFREYIEVALTSPLVAGNSYKLELYFNLGNNNAYTIDTIGAYFSNSIITGYHTHQALPYTPQLKISSGFITDSLNWIFLSGNYIAAGGESYLLIGNFNDDANTFAINTGIGGNPGGYYYADDISLSNITGINQQTEISNTSVYPNPFDEKIIVRNKANELSEIIVYDIASRKLLQKEFTNSVSLNTEQLSKGIYIYEVRDKKGLIKKGKVVKD